MINVIHVIPQPDGGGAELLVRELVRRLPAYGIESSAIYFKNPGEALLSEREEELGFGKAWDPRIIPALRNSIKSKSDESRYKTLVHAHLTWPLYFSPAALFGLKIPLFYTEHNTFNKRRKFSALRPVEKRVYSKYSGLVSISEGASRNLKDWLCSSNESGLDEVILNGARLFGMMDGVSSDATEGLNLISIGSLSEQKGFDISIRAVSQCREIVSSYMILGEGAERSRLEALVNEHGLEGIVSMPGYVEDIEAALQSANLGLIPSRWEGFGLVAPEMLSVGLPVVASQVEGMNEVLRGCGAALQVPPDDVSALSDGIRLAAEKLVGRGDIQELARLHAQKFSMEGMVERYADLYRRHVKKVG